MDTLAPLSYEDFAKVDIRLGKVVRVEDFPRAKKPAYRVWVDFGPSIGVLQTSAQVTVNDTHETLLGKKVLGCVNLGEKNIAGFVSQFLLLGVTDENGNVCLATVSHDALLGAKLH
ncbi:MAG: tRNA-binding protein [Candidatus Puniceispirillum sp.]|nr:tRNA-binding protein [Candidatus Puniceispirillum sp.]